MNTNILSLQAARRYSEELDWGIIPIMRGTKRPPERFPLTQYFQRRATGSELDSLFPADRNLAVCLGNVSDGLIVRDFDEVPAYDSWATDHPSLAKRLPTARTARGFHVYFNADVSDVRDLSPGGGSILVGGDGELKAGGYVLLPPSVHPNGHRYEWMIEPDDVPFVSDIQRAGLAPKGNRCNTSNIKGPGSALAGIGGLGITVKQAVECSQPTGHGERNHRIFDFCRMLKSTKLADSTQEELRPAFERWFRLARPRIKTKDFPTSWREFLAIWRIVKTPFGSTMRLIAEDIGDSITVEQLCDALQKRAGDRPFHLDCRTAGKLVGVHYSTASRHLNRLMDSGKLELVKPGDRLNHLAAEYRYHEPQNPRPPKTGEIT